MLIDEALTLLSRRGLIPDYPTPVAHERNLEDPGSSWGRPGLLFRRTTDGGPFYVRLQERYMHEAPILRETSGWELVVEEPGTSGWLLEFVRSAYENPHIFTMPSVDEDGKLFRWGVYAHDAYGAAKAISHGETEGKAMAEALIRRAELAQKERT